VAVDKKGDIHHDKKGDIHHDKKVTSIISPPTPSISAAGRAD
jgi:hypothetical protein